MTQKLPLEMRILNSELWEWIPLLGDEFTEIRKKEGTPTIYDRHPTLSRDKMFIYHCVGIHTLIYGGLLLGYLAAEKF